MLKPPNRYFVLSLGVLFAGLLQAGEHGKLEIYPDLEYLIAAPSDCPSWMLANSLNDAAWYYMYRKDCTDSRVNGIPFTDLFIYRTARFALRMRKHAILALVSQILM